MPTVALVTMALEHGGGVPSVVSFLHDVLTSSDRYRCRVVSLATSSTDPASIRLADPRSWRPVRTEARSWNGIDYTHVGARGVELEWQRYQPRAALSRLLGGVDLVQVVAGGPALARAVVGLGRPTCAFVATTSAHERQALLDRKHGVRRAHLRLTTAINDRLERHALARLDCVQPESDYTARLVAPWVEPHRMEPGLPGVDVSAFRPGPTYQADGPILAVGRWADPRKNVRLLLEAYARLLDRRPHGPDLVLAGLSAPSAHDMALVDALGIGPRVKLEIGVGFDALAELYRSASLYVLSSDEEGLGVVLLEAMASGLPVVSTRCGGPSSVVESGVTGELTPVGDVGAMAKAIEVLLDDPGARSEMGATARRRAVEQYSTLAAGERYLATWDRLLGIDRG